MSHHRVILNPELIHDGVFFAEGTFFVDDELPATWTMEDWHLLAGELLDGCNLASEA